MRRAGQGPDNDLETACDVHRVPPDVEVRFGAAQNSTNCLAAIHSKPNIQFVLAQNGWGSRQHLEQGDTTWMPT